MKFDYFVLNLHPFRKIFTWLLNPFSLNFFPTHNVSFCCCFCYLFWLLLIFGGILLQNRVLIVIDSVRIQYGTTKKGGTSPFTVVDARGSGRSRCTVACRRGKEVGDVIGWSHGWREDISSASMRLFSRSWTDSLLVTTSGSSVWIGTFLLRCYNA